MRAIRVHNLGELDALQLDEDVPSPTPGPGQVRIAVHAAGGNFADILTVAGTYQYKPEIPFSPGLECAGEIIDVGDGVTDFKPGDRVMANLHGGGYAEEVVAEAASVEPMHVSHQRSMASSRSGSRWRVLRFCRFSDVYMSASPC